MSTFDWWEITPYQRKMAAQKGAITNRKKAEFLAKRHGPKIHALRVAGMSWRAISESMVMSAATAQKRYEWWLSHNPEFAHVSVADTKMHVAWTLRQSEHAYAEIAKRMKVKAATVKTWVRRWDADKNVEYLSAVGGLPLWASHPDTLVPGGPDAPRPSDR